MLIGLLGYATVGKDEACRQLGFARCAFADALKAAVDPIFPAGTPKEIKRETYVAYGRAMRRIDPDHWLKQLVIPDAENVCVADVRYLNECRYLLGRGARLIWIHRPGVVAANDEERASFDAIYNSALFDAIEHVNNIGDLVELREVMMDAVAA